MPIEFREVLVPKAHSQIVHATFTDLFIPLS